MSRQQRPNYVNTKFSDAINDKRFLVSFIIEIDYGLLDELLAMNVMTHQQIEEIRSLPLKTNQINKLLDYVISFSPVQQKQFFWHYTRLGRFM